MNICYIRTLFSALAITLVSLPASALYTTVDISSIVNRNIGLNAQTIPIGTTTGNQGTTIPFTIYPYNGLAGLWSGYAGTVTVSNIDAPGQASFYALLNNFYGTPGIDEYDITITTTNNDSITYQSIGGVDTRDYNQNVFTNTLSGTTFPWFDNGVGQRLDVREFMLPTSFKSETISSFKINQINPADVALLSGITFSSQTIITALPEPHTYATMLAGLVAICTLARRRPKLQSAA